MPLEILIVEDELLVADRLKRLTGLCLSKIDHHVRHAVSTDRAESFLNELDADLIFLDLNLSGEDGFVLLQKFAAKAAHTIIVSANTDRAIEAFEYGAIDFVAKPFTRARLEKALSRFSFSDDQLFVRTDQPATFISFETAKGVEILPSGQIAYFEAVDKYTEAVTLDGQRRFHAKSMTKLVDLLEGQFIRIHKSYLVQRNRIRDIRSLEGSRYEAQMIDGYSLPVGRTRIDHVREVLSTS